MAVKLSYVREPQIINLKKKSNWSDSILFLFHSTVPHVENFL